jgi:hypothetical protein
MQERITERDLVQALKAAREKKEEMELKLKAAKDAEMKAEAALIELLEANSADATAHYEGVGHFKLMKPRLYASVKKENEDKLFAFLEEIGREDLVKTVVPAPTLSTFVKERMENGEAVPEFVEYYLKQSLRLFA